MAPQPTPAPSRRRRSTPGLTSSTRYSRLEVNTDDLDVIKNMERQEEENRVERIRAQVAKKPSRRNTMSHVSKSSQEPDPKEKYRRLLGQDEEAQFSSKHHVSSKHDGAPKKSRRGRSTEPKRELSSRSRSAGDVTGKRDKRRSSTEETSVKQRKEPKQKLKKSHKSSSTGDITGKREKRRKDEETPRMGEKEKSHRSNDGTEPSTEASAGGTEVADHRRRPKMVRRRSNSTGDITGDRKHKTKPSKGKAPTEAVDYQRSKMERRRSNSMGDITGDKKRKTKPSEGKAPTEERRKLERRGSSTGNIHKKEKQRRPTKDKEDVSIRTELRRGKKSRRHSAHPASAASREEPGNDVDMETKDRSTDKQESLTFQRRSASTGNVTYNRENHRSRSKDGDGPPDQSSPPHEEDWPQEMLQSSRGIARESKSIRFTDKKPNKEAKSRRRASTGGIVTVGAKLNESTEASSTQIKKLGESLPVLGDSEFVLVPKDSIRNERRGSTRSGAERIDFMKDDPKEMTRARRFALRLMGKKWYNPAGRANYAIEDVERATTHGGHQVRVTEAHRPSLERAWAYFEHVTLPRYVVEPKPETPQKSLCVRMYRKMRKGDKTLDRAEPGENILPTKLYSPIFTPLSQMGDFGLGIGLYFSTLRALTILTLIAGLINIPNLIYFSGSDYSDSQPGVPPLLKGSAICTNQVWVPCESCTVSDFEDDKDRLANATTVDENGNVVNLMFALQNDCDGATLQQGMINYGTLILTLLGVLMMNIYQKYMEVKYDEDEQTAQDYSIVITNPPPEATDPKEWQAFFKDNFNAHATVVTVAVDNDFLVRSLVERRACMRKIELLLDPGTPLDDLTLARIASQIEQERSFFARLGAMVIPGIPELLGRVTILNTRVQGLAQQDYPASNVFVTFETEAAQRRVLSALSVGSLTASHNKIEVMSDHPNYLFRGIVLNVKEPEEPSTVRWQDLNAKLPSRLKEVLMTTLATFAMIAVIAFLIRALNGVDAALAAFAIAAANGVFPEFAKLLTKTESHATEGGKQTSLYFKIAVFRWVNTAIIITIITPFTRTLDNDDGLIRSIGAIFFADIVTTNTIQFLDPMGHIRRHVLAPRAKTQDLMNLDMQGQEVELAERYTNMTKILFLALWYCSIYPCALFLCAFALFINFFMDRFSLMRTWKRAPALGTTISKFSRRYFFSTAIVAMAVVSSYTWAGFTFDNLCDTGDEPVDPIYYGNWSVTTLGSQKMGTATVDIFSEGYKYCLQDMFRLEGRSFPALPQFQPEGSEWMTDEQETVTLVYGCTSVGIIVIVALIILWGWYQAFRGLFRSTYEPNGEDQGINFSDVPSISTYVPQVVSNVFSYPLFACNIDGIDEELFDWNDPDRPYSYYDLTKDADELLRGMDISHKHVFSTLRHWPPNEQEVEY